MTMRKFRVRFETEVEIEIDDKLLKSCNTDEWRAEMLPYTRDEQFAEHIAFNMGINRIQLRSIDGYADQPAGSVVMPSTRSRFDWEVEATEIK